jgi:hypothetical protein
VRAYQTLSCSYESMTDQVSGNHPPSQFSLESWFIFEKG